MEHLVRLKKNGEYWQAWWIDHEGARKVKSLGARRHLPKTEALKICVRMTVDNVDSKKRKLPSLGLWCKRYKELRRSELAPATRTIHARACDLLLTHLGSDRAVDSISREDAVRWRLALSQDLGDATVCKYVRASKVIFASLVDQDLVQSNVFDRLRGTARPVEREHLNLTEDQMADVWGGCDSSVWVALCWYAGLRKMEAYNLQWRDIDWDRGRLIVRNDGVVTSKARRREVRMEPQLKDMLLMFWGAETCYASTCSDRVLQELNRHTKINKWLQQRCAHEGVTLQQLRRCRDTIWHQQFPAYVCSAWLGHSEQVARKYYLSVPDELYSSHPTTLVDDTTNKEIQ